MNYVGRLWSFGTSSDEVIVPEYWHPEANDSGLVSTKPDFVPQFTPDKGIFLVDKITFGKVYIGKSKSTLEGKQTIACVEVLYHVIGDYSQSKVRLFDKPRTSTS